MSEDVVCVLASEIIFLTNVFDRSVKASAHLVKQGDAPLLAISEHNQGLESRKEVPAVRNPCETVRACRNADGIRETGFRHRQAVYLPLGEYECVGCFRVAPVHSEEYRLAVLLAPFFRLVSLLVEIRFPVLHELHLAVLIEERKDDDVVAVFLGSNRILSRDPFRNPTRFQKLNCRRSHFRTRIPAHVPIFPFPPKVLVYFRSEREIELPRKRQHIALSPAGSPQAFKLPRFQIDGERLLVVRQLSAVRAPPELQLVPASLCRYPPLPCESVGVFLVKLVYAHEFSQASNSSGVSSISQGL